MNGQPITPIEAKSSPVHIAVIKGSSVWLHWNYTYVGDWTGTGRFRSRYDEQVIQYQSRRTRWPSAGVLATRIGENGVLKVPKRIPAVFYKRFEVISSNSTLVIHDLQYNDSSYLFSSTVKVSLETGGRLVPYTYNLKPIVTITINGMSFCQFLW